MPDRRTSAAPAVDQAPSASSARSRASRSDRLLAPSRWRIRDDVVLHRLGGDEQLPAHLAVGLPRDEQRRHLAFALAELSPGAAAAAPSGRASAPARPRRRRPPRPACGRTAAATCGSRASGVRAAACPASRDPSQARPTAPSPSAAASDRRRVDVVAEDVQPGAAGPGERRRVRAGARGGDQGASRAARAHPVGSARIAACMPLQCTEVAQTCGSPSRAQQAGGRCHVRQHAVRLAQPGRRDDELPQRQQAEQVHRVPQQRLPRLLPGLDRPRQVTAAAREPHLEGAGEQLVPGLQRGSSAPARRPRGPRGGAHPATQHRRPGQQQQVPGPGRAPADLGGERAVQHRLGDGQFPAVQRDERRQRGRGVEQQRRPAHRLQQAGGRVRVDSAVATSSDVDGPGRRDCEHPLRPSAARRRTASSARPAAARTVGGREDGLRLGQGTGRDQGQGGRARALRTGQPVQLRAPGEQPPLGQDRGGDAGGLRAVVPRPCCATRARPAAARRRSRPRERPPRARRAPSAAASHRPRTAWSSSSPASAGSVASAASPCCSSTRAARGSRTPSAASDRASSSGSSPRSTSSRRSRRRVPRVTSARRRAEQRRADQRDDGPLVEQEPARPAPA